MIESLIFAFSIATIDNENVGKNTGKGTYLDYQLLYITIKLMKLMKLTKIKNLSSVLIFHGGKEKKTILLIITK